MRYGLFSTPNQVVVKIRDRSKDLDITLDNDHLYFLESNETLDFIVFGYAEFISKINFGVRPISNTIYCTKSMKKLEKKSKFDSRVCMFTASLNF